MYYLSEQLFGRLGKLEEVGRQGKMKTLLLIIFLTLTTISCSTESDQTEKVLSPVRDAGVEHTLIAKEGHQAIQIV